MIDISDPTNPMNVAHADASKAEGVVLALGFIYLDNWIYSQNFDEIRVYSISGPPLSIRQTSTNTLLLSWPSPSRVVLQANANLAGPEWVDLTNASTTNSGQMQVVLPRSAAKQYYRLRSP